MSIALVQEHVDAGNSSPYSLAFPSNITAGNLIVVTCACIASTDVTVACSDSLGNSYQTACIGGNNAAANQGVGILFYALNVAGGANTVILTASGGIDYIESHLSEWSGLAVSSALDGVAQTASVSATQSSGPITTSSADLVIGYFGTYASSTTVPSPFTELDIINGDASFYFIQTSSGTVSATFNQDNAYAFLVLAAFKPVTKQSSLLLGVGG